MQPTFSDWHVLVSGGGSGIGAALARQLLQAGARVSVLDLEPGELPRLQAQYPKHLLWQQLDVADAMAVTAAVLAWHQQAPINKLACCAGKLQMGRIWELSPAQWDDTFATNTRGIFNLCRVVAPLMIEQAQGAIVNVSSNAATTPRAGMGAYAASKAAVTQLSRCLGLELSAYGIRVNVVSPGSTDTAMQRAMWQQGSSRQTVIAGAPAQWRLGIPLQKIATPDEIADAIIFLLSDRASHITLHDLRVDGGATLDQ